MFFAFTTFPLNHLEVIYSWKSAFSCHISNQLRACMLRTSEFLIGWLHRILYAWGGFLTGIIIKAPTTGGRDFNFTMQRQGNFFPWRSLSTPEKAHPIFWSRVAKWSILIGLQVLSRSNFPDGISPIFLWSCKCSFLTSMYYLAANHVWNFLTW